MKTFNWKKFGRQIADNRLHMDLNNSYREVSKLIGIGEVALQRAENGYSFEVTVLLRICDFLSNFNGRFRNLFY